MGYTIKLMYPPVIKHGLLGNPKLHGEWENHETRWWILQQTMFEYKKVNIFGGLRQTAHALKVKLQCSWNFMH